MPTSLRLGLAAVAAGLMTLLCQNTALTQDVSDEDVQTRGPVHEAFAAIVPFNAEPGIVVNKPPPEPIEEMPPDEKPEGENVTWIPGYWGWDDDRNDYLWISGTWRALPPGRAWIAGYWAPTGQGYQWTSGYWVDSTQREATYLPEPPASIEVGPNVPAPSPDYVWMPGCWVWGRTQYAWRPGYWAIGRPDWDWVPPHYVWSPGGYVFVGGYWDYPVERRGVLFAPVFFGPRFHRPHFVYSPSIVIDLGVFTDHLFCRPRYHHYYFGDYYAPAYARAGIYASFSFHVSRRGFDPIYAQHRWEHRQDRDWEHRLEASYHNRRDHEDARPPRTWIQQKNISVSKTTVRENRVVVASSYDQFRRRPDAPTRFQPVAREERERLVQRTREVQSVREQRRTVEVRGTEQRNVRVNDGRAIRNQIPKSTIVAQPIREQRNSPPKEPRAPRPDPRVEPRREQRGRDRDRDRDRGELRSQERAETLAAPVEAPRRSTAPTVTPSTPVTPSNPRAPVVTSRPERPVQSAPERRVQPVPEHRGPMISEQQRNRGQEQRNRVQEERNRVAQSQQFGNQEAQRNARVIEGRGNQRQQQQQQLQPSNDGRGRQGRKGAEHLKRDDK